MSATPENSILIVSDMADLRVARHDNPERFRNMDFIFSSRDGHKLHGWVPDFIFISDRAGENMAQGVEELIKLRRVQGSKVCPVN